MEGPRELSPIQGQLTAESARDNGPDDERAC